MEEIEVATPVGEGQRYFEDPTTRIFHFEDFTVQPFNYSYPAVPVQMDPAVPLFIEGVTKVHQKLLTTSVYKHRETMVNVENALGFDLTINFGLGNGGYVECSSFGRLCRPQFKGMPFFYTELVKMSIWENEAEDATKKEQLCHINGYILSDLEIQMKMFPRHSECNLDFQYFEDVRITLKEVEAPTIIMKELDNRSGSEETDSEAEAVDEELLDFNGSLDPIDQARIEMAMLDLSRSSIDLADLDPLHLSLDSLFTDPYDIEQVDLDLDSVDMEQLDLDLDSVDMEQLDLDLDSEDMEQLDLSLDSIDLDPAEEVNLSLGSIDLDPAEEVNLSLDSIDLDPVEELNLSKATERSPGRSSLNGGMRSSFGNQSTSRGAF